ncbi:MAG: rod shape-determining protein MreD [Sphingomonas bacterium]|nr:rod shape-determining protein MreD [Sphingomonas bacterium]MDB5688966.1 rod shape-determining protein MreD [Sphingomonas bacterium]
MNRILPGTVPRTLPLRAYVVPVASTIAGSALAALPIVADAPVLPPFGLMMALGWRLLRSEIWRAWMALPIGLADDLLTGMPLGSGPIVLTICFLVFDAMDTRSIWRDYWQDWLITAAALAFCMVAGWAIVRFDGGSGSIGLIVPQFAMAIFCVPLTVRVCAALDAWRLRR